MSHIETIEKMMESIVEKAHAAIESNDEMSIHDFGELVDAIKDLSEAKYKCTIVNEMEKTKEDEEIMDRLARMDDGVRGYGTRYPRDNMGRFVTRNYTTPYWDSRMPMDQMSGYREPVRMDYTGGGSTNNGGMRDNSSMMNYGGNRIMSESGYDRARRNYTEIRDANNNNTPEAKQNKLNGLERLLKEFDSSVMELAPGMTAEEKSLTRQHFNTLATKI